MFDDEDEEMRMTLQVLGLGFEELHRIQYGNKVLPPPPVGNPREGMKLEDQRFHVAPGEYIKIDYWTEEIRTTAENLGPLVREPVLQRLERFAVGYPSNYSQSDLTLDALWSRLLFFGNDGQEIQDIVNYSFSFRHILFWPNEKLYRPYTEHEGKIYAL